MYTVRIRSCQPTFLLYIFRGRVQCCLVCFIHRWKKPDSLPLVNCLLSTTLRVYTFFENWKYENKFNTLLPTPPNWCKDLNLDTIEDQLSYINGCRLNTRIKPNLSLDLVKILESIVWGFLDFQVLTVVWLRHSNCSQWYAGPTYVLSSCMCWRYK